jgi:hypothetical protein
MHHQSRGAHFVINVLGFEALVQVRKAERLEGSVIQSRRHRMRDWPSEHVEVLCGKLANQIGVKVALSILDNWPSTPMLLSHHC